MDSEGSDGPAGPAIKPLPSGRVLPEVVPPPPPTGPPAGPPGRDPRRIAAVAAAVIALLVVAGLVARGLGGGDPEPSSSPASPPVTTAAVPPPPGPGLLGVSVPRGQGETATQVVDGIKAEFGGLPVARVFSSTLPPATWDADPTLAALGTGSAVVYSFKGNVQEVARGDDDALISGFLASKPTGVTAWVAFHHEPEDEVADGDFTAAEFRAANEHLAPMIRAAGAVPTTILMQYTLSTESHRDWHDYYSASATDVLAWDAYNSGQKRSTPTYKAPADFVDPVVAVARETGKPFGWAEFGSPCISSDPGCSGRAAWLKATGTAFRAAGAEFALYWNAKTDVDFTLGDAGSVDALKQLVAG